MNASSSRLIAHRSSLLSAFLLALDVTTLEHATFVVKGGVFFP
ncbi:MAG TPA: hypothetical protein VM733_18235 [Thermoanaerobaculia bacterium]|nr:hypothetical protein [Thermoanaerobaculia bacterium]